MQTFENLLLQNYSAEFLDIENTYSLWVCVIKFCSNGSAPSIISELKAKDNLNIANFMQTFENLFLQNYSTEFLDIAHNYCKTLIFSEPFNLAKLAIVIKTLKIKAAKIK